ncbi:hypothetical protein LTR66_010656 [Elasticomyces elasticus]|nr:hypothetical protein LTR66_010656 [Elasticomyces elasticus]
MSSAKGQRDKRDRSAITATPPQSFIDPPLTPPPTEEHQSARVASILHTFREIWCGQHAYLKPWTPLPLSYREYLHLQRALEKDRHLDDFVHNKFRYDYDPYAQQLIIRMPSCLHERMVTQLRTDIGRQLGDLIHSSAGGEGGRFAQGIADAGSSTILFEPDTDVPVQARREPDISFQHVDAKYPGVIIEVSYSQKMKDLPHLADDYLLGSDGSIRAMVGLNVEYHGSKKATISVWRPAYVEGEEGKLEFQAVQTVQEEVIRNEDGTPSNTSVGLRLELQDFAHNELINARLTEQRNRLIPISITPAALCEFLANAERFARGPNTSSVSIESTVRAGVKKRRLTKR